MITQRKVYNFLDHRLEPEVNCNAPVSDDFKPENLVSSKPGQFMAYNVVKPPIELRFKFLCKIDVLYIKIWSQIGSLKSTAFEISTKDVGRIAVGSCDEVEYDGVCFYKSTVPESVARLSTSQFFKNLRSTEEIILTVKRTNRCPPVLKRIEIWGSIARSCTIETLQKVEKLFSPPSTKTIIDNTKETIEKINENKDNAFQIPEEFLDVITWNIITLPFTLPSGKVIDEQTIEKHNHMEAEWGRPPSDPFTGQAYTNDRKPIFNAGLKARIDRFLIEHSEMTEIKETPRTVGTNIAPKNMIVERKNPLALIDFRPEMSFEAQVQEALSVIRRSNSSRLTTNPVCQTCQKKDNLYQITKCRHFICRTCLLGTKDSHIKCNRCPCSSSFGRSDVQKFHSITK